jgi:biotin carboxyl carrier protein
MRRVRLVLRASGEPETLELELDGSRFALARSGSVERGEIARMPDGRLSLLFEDGRQICGGAVEAGPGEVELSTRSGLVRLALAEPLRDRLAHSGGLGPGEAAEEEVRALMPGRVVEVAVAEGGLVEAGGLLLVLEAMKMQNEIRSARGGRVARLAVSAGTAVDGGALLAVVHPEPRPGIQ